MKFLCLIKTNRASKQIAILIMSFGIPLFHQLDTAFCLEKYMLKDMKRIFEHHFHHNIVTHFEQ